MKTHGRKLAAPIVIAVILVAYYIGFAAVCIWIPGLPLAIKLVFGIVPLALAGVCIAMLVERIREIRSGEEDDLGQY